MQGTALSTSRTPAATSTDDEPAATLARLAHSYGRTAVAPDERSRRIRAIFAAIAPGYDRANDWMSLGLHRRWKDRLAVRVEVSGGAVLDLAGGTGDVAARVRRRGAGLVVNADASEPMLRVDRSRHAHRSVVVATAEALPLASDGLAAVTLAFGLRNFTSPLDALTEIRRVLRPGGRLHLLEFSRPVWWLRPFYRALSAWLLPLLGGLVTGRPAAYRYLAQSIDAFPDATAVAAALEQAGFRVREVELLAFGIAAIHVAERPRDEAACTP